MARKLSAAELARFTTDFDPPTDMEAGKVQQRKKATPQPTGGRPKKHENTRPVSFRLPEETIKRIRIKAIVDGVSPADLIIEWADGLDVPGLS